MYSRINRGEHILPTVGISGWNVMTMQVFRADNAVFHPGLKLNGSFIHMNRESFTDFSAVSLRCEVDEALALWLYKHPYLSHWFRVCKRKRRLWDLMTLPLKIKAPTPATKPLKLSQGELCYRALPFGGLWFPLKQHGLQMGLLGRHRATACVGRDTWRSPATTPLCRIKSPLTTGLFTVPPAPTNTHEKPPTSQSLLGVLHGEELKGDGYQSGERAGALGNKQESD